jgi:tyrosyl-tRNA synthetase
LDGKVGRGPAQSIHRATPASGSFAAMHVPADEQLRLLRSGAVHVISEPELGKRLAEGRPLRVKLGLDPTAPDLHLGSAVVLRKLRQFQDLGHKAVIILGDFTAQVGDPTGKSTTRPRLNKDEVDAHAVTYIDQLGAVLDLTPERLEVRRNSEWLATMGIEDVLRLAARTTVARMLERDDFERRYKGGEAISVHEFLYPLLQGWDSVIVKADVELGGTDQLFNNLVGRDLQGQEGQPPQIVLTTPLLEGTDGVQKMSKSLGNYVGLTESPRDQFGKLMRIPDSLLERYLQYATGWPPERFEVTRDALRSGELAPVAAKRLLGRTVVDLYHGDGSGAGAEAEFDRVHKAREEPDDMVEFRIEPEMLRDGKILVANLLMLAGLATSTSEGRRKIADGGVRLRGEVVHDEKAEVFATDVDSATLQVGRRGWVRLRAPGAS